jgi:subtilase family serine protease
LAAGAVCAPKDRLSGPIDAANAVALKGNVHPLIRGLKDRGAVNGATRIGAVTLALKPTDAQQADLEQFLEEQRDPSSSNYQRWLTPEEYADRFGVSSNDLAQISSWLTSQGFTIDHAARGRTWIGISGTAEQFNQAFRADLRHYQVDGERHFANAGEPSIPGALAGVVAEIRGLHDFRMKPHLRAEYTSGSGAHYLAPDDLAAIYNIAPFYQAGFDGTGQKIVVVGQTDINLADLQAFRTKFNLAAKDPQVVLYGPDPGTTQGDLGEADLDLEWAGAVARNATIIYVNSRNVSTSAQYAVDQNLAPVISMSYGGCEAQNSSSFRSIAQQANAQGITWVASSGDAGAAGCETVSAKVATHGPSVEIPASIPEVTGIGGTTFSEGSGTYWNSGNSASGASVLSYIPETSWNDSATRNSLSATGGGASVYYAKPAWQVAPGVPADGKRDVPDVSFAASPDHDGYLFYTGGTLGAVGGTSVPTPAFAGVLGLLNQYLMSKGTIAKAGLGNINPTLYHIAQSANTVYHDITTGNNIVPCTTGTTGCAAGSFGFSAGSGYDQVTGLGSMDAWHLASSWTSTPASISTTTTVTANPASIAASASTQVTATVKPASGTATPTGTVTFATNGKTLGAATVGSAGTAVLTVPGSQLATGSNTISASYGGSSTFGASSGAVAVTVTAPNTVNSQVVASVNPNPVYQTSNYWQFTIALAEQAGAATTLTNFTLNGTSYASQIKTFFGSNQIAAKGTLSANLRMSGLTPPTNITFGFAGADPSGRQWTTSITVPFNGVR